MVRRQAPQDLRISSPLQVASQQVNTYYRPNQSRPDVPTAFDLAPLSDSLTGLFGQIARNKQERDAQSGAAFAVNNPDVARRINNEARAFKDPEEQRDFMRSAFQKLINKGEIQSSASPFFQIGFQQATARGLVGTYRRNLNNRLNEVSALVDGDGNPVEPVNPDALINEEWAKIADNSPVLKEFYGSQAATGLKERVDEEFLSASDELRGRAIEDRHVSLLQEDIAGRLDQIGVLETTDGPDATQLQRDLTAFISESVHGANVQDPRGLVMQAGELSISRAANIDAEEGLRVLETLQDVRIQGQRLGDNPEHGITLERRKAQLHAQAEQDQVSDLRARETKRQLAIQEAEGSYVPAIQDALSDPSTSLSVVVSRLEDELRASPDFDEETLGFAIEGLRVYSQKAQQSQSTDQEIFDSVANLLADGNVDGAREYLSMMAITDGVNMTGQDRLQLQDLIDSRGELSQFIERAPEYTTAVSRVSRLATVATDGLNPIAAREQAQGLQLELRRLDEDFQAYVATTANEPDRRRLHREWLNTREQEIGERFTAGADAKRDLQTDVRTKISDTISKRGDARGLIERAEAQGLLTADEARATSLKAAEALNREDLFRLPAYRESQARLSAITRTEASNAGLTDILTGGLTSEALIFEEQLQRAARDRMESWLDENLGSIAPERLESRMRGAIEDIEDDLSTSMANRIQRFQGSLAAGRGVIDAGERTTGEAPGPVSEPAAGVGPAEADGTGPAVERGLPATVVTPQQASLSRADAFDQAPSSALSVDHPVLARDPEVAPKAVQAYLDHIQGKSRGLFTPAPKLVEVEDAFAKEGLSILARPDLDDARKQEAVLSMYRLSGIGANSAIGGVLVVRRPDQFRRPLEQRAQQFETYVRRSGGDQSSFYGRQAAANRELAGGEEVVPLGDSLKQDPYGVRVFGTLREMEDLRTLEPQKWAELMAAFGIELTDEAQGVWMDRQVGLILRSGPPQ